MKDGDNTYACKLTARSKRYDNIIIHQGWDAGWEGKLSETGQYTYYEMMGCSSGIISAVITFTDGRNYLCCAFAVTTVSMLARFAYGICKSQKSKSVI